MLDYVFKTGWGFKIGFSRNEIRLNWTTLTEKSKRKKAFESSKFGKTQPSSLTWHKPSSLATHPASRSSSSQSERPLVCRSSPVASLPLKIIPLPLDILLLWRGEALHPSASFTDFSGRRWRHSDANAGNCNPAAKLTSGQRRRKTAKEARAERQYDFTRPVKQRR